MCVLMTWIIVLFSVFFTFEDLCANIKRKNPCSENPCCCGSSLAPPRGGLTHTAVKYYKNNTHTHIHDTIIRAIWRSFNWIHQVFNWECFLLPSVQESKFSQHISDMFWLSSWEKKKRTRKGWWFCGVQYGKVQQQKPHIKLRHPTEKIQTEILNSKIMYWRNRKAKSNDQDQYKSVEVSPQSTLHSPIHCLAQRNFNMQTGNRTCDLPVERCTGWREPTCRHTPGTTVRVIVLSDPSKAADVVSPGRSCWCFWWILEKTV